MEQLILNITQESETKLIASSAFNFRIELVINIGKDDFKNIFTISQDLANIFGNNFLLDENNIYKYFKVLLLIRNSIEFTPLSSSIKSVNYVTKHCVIYITNTT